MLGGMERELDSELLGRLQRHYGEMSDGELLRLAASAGDLTDMAQEVLRGEMQSRKLKLEDAVGDPFAAMERAGLIRDPLPKPEMSTELARGMVALRTFHDAIEAGTACDCLEAEGLEIDVRDVTAPNSGLGSMYGGPPVALQLIVRGADRERAMAILRAKMGLFPLQEVEGTDAQVDDGTVATLGTFGRRADADEVARVLEEARIWHRVVADPEGCAANDDAYVLEVKEVDLVKAGEVVERSMNLPEA
jgi:hypothetical protein